MVVLLILFCFLWLLLCLYTKEKGNAFLSTGCKGLASLQFVLLAFCHFHSKDYFILMGLILGFVADIVIDIRFVKKEKKYVFFILGSGIFLWGHVFYVLHALNSCLHPILFSMIGILFGLCISYCLLKIVNVKKSFQIFGSIYICMVSLFATISIGNYIECLNSNFLAIGSFLFLISDCMLIINTFNKKSTFLRFIYLVLYYSAQLLIAFSIL